MKASVILTFLVFCIFSVYGQEKNVVKGRSKSKIINIGNKSQGDNNDNEVKLENEKKPDIYKIADVDLNIPKNNKKYPYRFALIIGNEDYKSYQTDLETEINVDFAENDARIFREYANHVLGVPDENIVLLINAKTVETHRAIEQMRLLLKNSAGKGELIFYYAGHGFPDIENREPYLLPVDVSSKDLNFAIKLKDLYAKLSEYPSQRVTIILDACFTGGARSKGFISGRMVKIKPKSNPLSGNMVVFSAVSETQVALSYDEMQHGMFTYWLLKKLQDTKGKVTYNEIANYLQDYIGIKSLLINEKEQTPQINVSRDVVDKWKDWKFY